MNKELTSKEKIQILIKNRKPISFFTVVALIFVLYAAYLGLEIAF